MLLIALMFLCETVFASSFDGEAMVPYKEEADSYLECSQKTHQSLYNCSQVINGFVEKFNKLGGEKKCLQSDFFSELLSLDEMNEIIESISSYPKFLSRFFDVFAKKGWMIGCSGAFYTLNNKSDFFLSDEMNSIKAAHKWIYFSDPSYKREEAQRSSYWKIHVGVDPDHLKKTLDKVASVLLDKKVHFKIPRSFRNNTKFTLFKSYENLIYHEEKDGNFLYDEVIASLRSFFNTGIKTQNDAFYTDRLLYERKFFEQRGKLITIYPKNDTECFELSHTLDQMFLKNNIINKKTTIIGDVCVGKSGAVFLRHVDLPRRFFAFSNRDTRLFPLNPMAPFVASGLFPVYPCESLQFRWFDGVVLDEYITSYEDLKKWASKVSYRLNRHSYKSSFDDTFADALSVQTYLLEEKKDKKIKDEDVNDDFDDDDSQVNLSIKFLGDDF